MPEYIVEAMAQQDRWLTAHEASAYLGVEVSTLAKWRTKGTGPEFSCALRRDPRYLLSSLHRFMTSSVVTNTTEAHEDRHRRGHGHGHGRQCSNA